MSLTDADGDDYRPRTHPYAQTGMGTEGNLNAITSDDVRCFHSDHIRRGASVIVAVGDITPDSALKTIGLEFDALEWGEDDHGLEPAWPADALQAADQRDKQQTAIALLFPGPDRRDPARFAARVLSAIASGLGGRFFEQLRDRQSLAYTVSAFPVERRLGGAFAAYIATSPSREDEAREGLLREFARFRDEPPQPRRG